MLDADGYFILARKTERSRGCESVLETAPAPPAEKPKKTPKPRFKKGGWKAAAWKILRSSFIPPTNAGFNDVHVKDLLVGFGKTSDKASRVIETSEGFAPEILRSFKDKYNNRYVLVKATHNTYLRMTPKSYRRLREIKRMHVSMSLEAEFDDETTNVISQRDKVITNINELAYYITHQAHCIEDIYELEAESCGFVYYRHRFKIVVEKADGKVETYKGDMNNFMKAYGLDPF